MNEKMMKLKFETERLKSGPLTYDINQPPDIFDLLDDPEYEFKDPVRGELTLRLVSSTVLLSGSLSTFATGPCARCLEPLRIPLRTTFMLTYMTDERLLKPDEFPELVSDSTFWYDGEMIYPAENLRELLLLELPTIPACQLQPGDICPIRNVQVHPLVFGPQEDEEVPETEDDNSLKAQLRRLKKEQDEQR